METLAKQALHEPVEIQVGGRSVVNKDITQLIEIRPEADRFLRLLEILGEFYENGKILIFVASQDLCDNLFRDLLKVSAVLVRPRAESEATEQRTDLSHLSLS